MQTMALLLLVLITVSSWQGSIFRNEKVQTQKLMKHLILYLIVFGVYAIPKDMRMLIVVGCGIIYFVVDDSKMEVLSPRARGVVKVVLFIFTLFVSLDYFDQF